MPSGSDASLWVMDGWEKLNEKIAECLFEELDIIFLLLLHVIEQK